MRFFNHFNRIIFIHRKSKLEQAVTAAILGFGNQGSSAEEANKPSSKTQISDSEDLLLNISKLISKYHEDIKFFNFIKKSSKKPFLDISFEDIQLDKEASLVKIITFLRPDKNNSNLKLVINNNKVHNQIKEESITSLKEQYLNFICGKP